MPCDKIADIKTTLTDWMIGNLKHRDLLIKKIVKIEKNKKGFDIFVKYKDKEQFFVVEPTIQDIDKIMKKMNAEGHFALVVLNKKENLDNVIKKWSKLSEFKNLCIYFINPSSSTDKKWVVLPNVHNKICDPSTLEIGLRSMFEAVEPAI